MQFMRMDINLHFTSEKEMLQVISLSLQLSRNGITVIMESTCAS